MTNLKKANIKSEAYGYAIADATKAIELDPSFAKVCLVTFPGYWTTGLIGLYVPC